MPKIITVGMKSYTNVRKCQPNYVVIHTGEGNIQLPFWIEIPWMMQQVTMQLWLLVYETKARAGICLQKIYLIN